MPTAINDGLKEDQGHMASRRACAAAVMDSVPPVTRFIRMHLHTDPEEFTSLSQIRVLHFLVHAPGSSLSDVARFLGVTKATASSMVARMVDKGLIERNGCADERRCLSLRLTGEGRKLYQRVHDKTQAAVSEVLRNRTAEELQKISQGLALLREAFSK